MEMARKTERILIRGGEMGKNLTGGRRQHRQGRQIGLGGDLAKLAGFVGLGRGGIVPMGTPQEAQHAEQIEEESPHQGPSADIGRDAHSNHGRDA
jgi:hypothetical protein